MRRELPTPARLSLILAFSLALPASAQAQDFLDDDDDFQFDDAPAADEQDRLDEADDLEVDDSELDDLDLVEPEEGEDLLDGDETFVPAGDSAQIYRQREAQLSRLGPDEEYAGWEAYLAEYPNTTFAERIRRRMDELMDEIYSQRIDRGGEEVDALDSEVQLAQGILIENIDPRSRLRVGVEMGLPSWFNPFVDYEHAFARTFSAHVGIRQRYTGMSIEPGVKWALVKSTRTQTLVTLLGDVHVNTGPTAFVGLRPMLAAGKRFGDDLHLQAQAGVEVEMREHMGLRLLGGLHATYRASDRVGLFVEGTMHMKNIGGDTGLGAFNVATFGMKIFPARKGDDVNENTQVDVGATAPFSSNYYAFHYGSILGQANFFLD